MDLIYMNSSKEDVGVLQDYEMDMAFGKDENNFECKLQANAHCCEAGHFLYMEGTEYGGIVDSIKSDTENGEVIYSGRTWHGILGSKIIIPLQDGEVSTDDVTVDTLGSKNLLLLEDRTYTTDDNVTYTISDGVVTVSGTPTKLNTYNIISGVTQPTLPAGTYTLYLGAPADCNRNPGGYMWVSGLKTFTTDAEWRLTQIALYCNTSNQNYTIYPMLLSGEYTEATLPEFDSYRLGVYNRYLKISGDANACIGYILERSGLSSLFTASAESSGVNVEYQFHRYTDVYSGLVKMLESVGMKLKTVFSNGVVVLSAVPKYNYATDEEFDSDLVDFKIQKNYKTVNHLICLGSGELENRTVIHLYADTEGNISQTQTQFDEDEYAAVYDYSSVESEEELIASGTDHLKSLWEQNQLSISFDDTSDAYDVGDVVGAVDNITKIAVSAVIRKKIVAIQNGQQTITYEVGE